MQVAIIGIDLGKTSCSLVGVETAGKVVLRRRMRRDTAVAFSKHPGSVAAMEACCGAHHIGRALAARGHEIRLMSPEHVRPYVEAQKNDDRDAEAASRPTMRFVTLKSEKQLDMQTLHRVRDRLVGDRTSLMNQIRSLLLERGHVVAQGRARLAAVLAELLDGGERVLSPRMHALIADMRRRWIALTPAKPISPISRSTVQRAIGKPSRIICRQTLRTPYTPKLSANTRAISGFGA